MFEFKTPATVRLTNLVCRVEAAGKKKDVPAVTLRLKLEGFENTILDLISPTARATFYAPVEGQEQLPDVEPTTPILRSKDIKHWAPEEVAFHGWKVVIDHGIDGASAIPMAKCKIDGFVVDLFEGGRVDMEFKVSTSDIDSEGVGILWASQKQQFPVTILAPEVPAAPIDGSVEAFKKDHPEFSEGADERDAADLFAAGAETDGPAGETEDPENEPDDIEGGTTDADKGENWPFPTGASDGSSDEERSARARAEAEQAELEAGMAASLAADGVKPKRSRAAPRAH